MGLDFELGRTRLPYADIESRAQSLLLIKEALEYPYAKSDDVLMALWFVKANLRGLYVPTAAVQNPGRKFHTGCWLAGGFRSPLRTR